MASSSSRNAQPEARSLRAAASHARQERARLLQGGPVRSQAKLKEQGKLPVRERIRLLCDPDSEFIEDGLFANAGEPELPADGLVTGIGVVNGRQVAVIASDPTVKAGSWGPLAVEKYIRMQENAERLEIPVVYLVDSAGARITDQIQMFPGRRHAGRIFHMQVHLSGQVPQVCVLFGPSAAGGAYVPAFCDVVIMIAGKASMYLGSPRMAEVVVGEHVTLEEMGGALMHCSVSGCGDILAESEEEGISACRTYLGAMPSSWRETPPTQPVVPPLKDPSEIADIVPSERARGYDVHDLIATVIDGGSFLEIKELFAKEVVTGLARIEGQTVGIVASQPNHKGGVLFVDSADKVARFVTCCDAFNVPLLFLADVPGFMIGTVVERQGIIRHGAKMIAALSSATVPKISVIVRKAYGAGLYAMCGPAFDPDCTLALPGAEIAVMGPEAAVNAVYFNKIQERPLPEREAYVAGLQEEYRKDIDVEKLASLLIIDDIVEPANLRMELARRFATYARRQRPGAQWRHHAVFPV